MYDDGEIVSIDEDSETLAHILTLIMKRLNPAIDLGGTYEIVIRLVMQMIYEPIVSTDIEECARDVGAAILDTEFNKPKSKH
jgi:hypothetical protein